MRGIDGTDERKGDMRIVVLLVALLLAALLAACGPTATPSGPEATAGATSPTGSAKALVGTEWVLTALRGSPLLEGTHITLKFEDERLSGFAGCNTYGGVPDSGRYIATDEGTLTVPMIAITVEACFSPEGVMEQERAYVEALRGVTAYQLDGERLELQDATGETILAFARQEEYDSKPSDLLGTAWQLVSMDGRAPVEGSTVTLVFHDGHLLSGDAGCRDYVAVYDADGDDLDLLFEAMLGADCSEEGLREQEGTYSTMLGGAAHYQLAKRQLEILTIRGETLLFEPLPEEAQTALEGPIWSLQAFVDPNPVEDMPAPLPLPVGLLAGAEITLALEGGTALGSAGCNTYQAAYTLDATSLAFEKLTFTEMACLTPESVMEQEGRYLALLRDVTAYHVYGGQLWLVTDDGRALVFSAKAWE